MRDARSAGVAALGIAVCLLLGWLSLRAYAPPRPAGTGAPAEAFSAARAVTTVEALARRPRPTGSEANVEARRHLLERLEEIGLETETHEATVLRARGGRLLGARVTNLLATLPGAGRDGAILLMAHYDSVPGSPGAGDDASGTAAVVEAARALAAGPPLARDVRVLVTDGEEAGLLGARAFARDQPWPLSDLALVLNFEARGSGGPVTMFESSAGNHRLVEEMVRAAPGPIASSLSYEVYRRMPNDTDFSILRRAGVTGLNFAMIGRYGSYHTRLDTVERLDPASVQHHGSYALSLARHFAELEEIPVAGADGVYFNLFGRRPLMSYSSNTARVLAMLLVALAAAAMTVRSRRHRGRVTGAGWGLMLWLGAAIAGVLAALAVWRAFVWIGPGLREAPHGVPWIAGWLIAAGVLLTVALVLTVIRLLGPLAEAADLWAGVLVMWTVLAVITSFFLAGGSYVFLWPAVAGWVGLWMAERLSGSRRWRAVVATVATLPAVILLTPVIDQVLEALTVKLSAPALVLVAWIVALLVVPLAEIARWGRCWVEIALVTVAAAVLAAAVGAAAPSGAAPATSHLLYVLDADVGRAFWLSADERPPEWTAAFLEAGAAAASHQELLPVLRSEARRGDADAIDLPSPVLEVARSDAEPERVVLKLVSMRGAPALHARIEAGEPFRLVSVDGEKPPPELLAAARDGARELSVSFFGPPAGGLEIEIESGGGPIEMRVVDQTYGLPALAGRSPKRPSHLIPPASWTSDSTFVSRHFVWSPVGDAPAPAAVTAGDVSGD